MLCETGGPPWDGLLQLRVRYKILALAGSMSGQQRLDLSECYEMLDDP